MKYRYSVIRNSGACAVYDNITITELFDKLFADLQVGGSTFDYPNMLLKDGKIVVPSGLSSIVSRVCYMKKAAIDEVYSAYSDAINNAISGMDRL